MVRAAFKHRYLIIQSCFLYFFACSLFSENFYFNFRLFCIMYEIVVTITICIHILNLALKGTILFSQYLSMCSQWVPDKASCSISTNIITATIVLQLDWLFPLAQSKLCYNSAQELTQLCLVIKCFYIENLNSIKYRKHLFLNWHFKCKCFQHV